MLVLHHTVHLPEHGAEETAAGRAWALSGALPGRPSRALNRPYLGPNYEILRSKKPVLVAQRLHVVLWYIHGPLSHKIW